jgi:hypothetical protein
MMPLAVIALLSLQQSSDKSIENICAVSQSPASRLVSLRGTGGKSGRDAVFVNYTCSVATTSDFTLPTTVLLNIRGFKDAETARRFQSLSVKTIFQAIVRGIIECRHPLKLRRSDDGDIVGGNGYGENGLYKCRMTNARLLDLFVLE